MIRRRLTSKQREAYPLKQHETVIDKGIPIPPKQDGRREWKYPWADMEVGDSMLIENLPSSSVSPQASKAGKALGRTFEIRKTDQGTRVWRTK